MNLSVAYFCKTCLPRVNVTMVIREGYWLCDRCGHIYPNIMTRHYHQRDNGAHCKERKQ